MKRLILPILLCLVLAATGAPFPPPPPGYAPPVHPVRVKRVRQTKPLACQTHRQMAMAVASGRMKFSERQQPEMKTWAKQYLAMIRVHRHGHVAPKDFR